ncbi:MAG TPA: LacI family DNA-binding transcriptional regulator [Longimicrobiaceae bacterium]|nr:LacI family DNA-binding transcriptional regulator [Longimicrobiaceae bacterium]
MASITIRDVAARAGVSIATVSRVLNGSGPVREETRARVEQVAAELNFTPHGAARSLITRRTDTFGVVLPDLFGEFFSEVIRGMDPLARGNGYHLLLSSSHDNLREIEFALQAMRGRVDGLIVMSPNVAAQALEPCLPGDVPVVLLNCEAAAGGARHAINVDNFGGARAMVLHLAGLGHRRIAMVGGSAGNFDARERQRGYLAALAEAGIAADPALEAAGDFTERGGYRAAEALARLDPRPTALFCANDSMAVGAMSALRAAGLRVPADVAVAGFDDIPIARYIDPALSSVHVDVHRLGALAVGMLCDTLGKETPHPPVHEMLPTRLVIRRSCGATGPGDEPANRHPAGSGADHARSSP